MHSEINVSSDDEISLKSEASNENNAETGSDYFCPLLPNYLQEYYYPPPFNIHCGYQYLSDLSNYAYDSSLPSSNVNNKEPQCNKYEDKNLAAKLKKLE